MSLVYAHSVVSLRSHKIRNLKHASAKGLSLSRRSTIRCCFKESVGNSEGTVERIKEMFAKDALLSVSAYDTAWVAMVPSRDFPNKPCFPECLDWLMENQHQDGSWGLHPRHPSLVKDYVSSTLACLLALQKWRAGEQLVQRGIDFIRSNAWSVTDEEQFSPIGFDIIFPSLINRAAEIGLNLTLDPVLVDRMLGDQARVIDSFKGNEQVLAYVAEGLEESYPWEELKMHQGSNGGILNSPATTAAALIHHHDNKCFEYIRTVMKAYKSGVPTAYPTEINARLYMVDAIERLGVDRFFLPEIGSVLNDTYRSWQLKSEEIFSDITCCARAFRLLRNKGYEISSDELARFIDQEQFFRTVSMQSTSLAAILELYKASQLITHPNDGTLAKINAWTRSYMKKQLGKTNRLQKEVERALLDVKGTLKRVETRQTLDLLGQDNFQILKTSYRCCDFVNHDLLIFATRDFNICQAQHLKELEQLERWYKESRLDQMKGTRSVLSTIYFLIAADFFNPEFSEARITYVQNVVLITLADDLFDNSGSMEELHTFLNLVKNWDEHTTSNYTTERVEILFSAIYNTTNEAAAKALIKQGRCIKNHLISLWRELVECMMKEAEWWKDEIKPTMDEYLSAARSTVGCELCILPALYILGPRLPDGVMSSEECVSMCKHVSTIARLMNDIQTYKKEEGERKPNSISLQIDQSHATVTEEEAIKKTKGIIENSCRQLLQMVLREKGSMFPKACKDLFWTTCKVSYILYSYGDEFSSPKETLKNMMALMTEPINFP